MIPSPEQDSARPLRVNEIRRCKSSESQFESQLDRTRSTDLIQRTQAGPIALAQARSQHFSCNPKLRWRNRGTAGRRAKIRVVEDIEEFSPELKFYSLSNWKLSTDGKVPLRCAEPTQSISPQIALPHRKSRHGINRRICKRIIIQRLSTRILRSVEVKGLSRNYIGTKYHLLPSFCGTGQIRPDSRGAKS